MKGISANNCTHHLHKHPVSMDIDGLRSTLNKHGQGHLLKFWDGLSSEDKEHFYKELTNIDYEEVTTFYKNAQESLNSSAQKIDDHLQPLSSGVCGSFSKTDPETLQSYEKSGLTAVSENKVAVLLLAGGQGTRLGVPYPKGMYDVGLPSKKTLYQIQAERILRVQNLGKKQTSKSGVIPWYIMTSEHTMEPTREFFAKNKYFGLQKEDVVLFEQSLLPCFSFDGEIILQSPSKIALAPDGNGGLYRALRRSKVLDDMEKRGIEYIHVYCVDNILVKMADPIFMGFCISKGANCAAKVVEKAFPTEAVGVVCKVDGVYQVVEYSEITQDTAEKRNEDGRLAFNAGNICNHFFTFDFLKHASDGPQESQLKHHVAKKKIPYVDSDSKVQKPTKPNGIKMEKFVFDVFQFATNFAVWDVLREDEFSPLKNADSNDAEIKVKDTPSTCRQALFNLHHRYVVKAGGKFVDGEGSAITTQPSDIQNGNENDQSVICEISPLVSFAGEGLEEHVSGQALVSPVTLEVTPENGKPLLQQGSAK
ncbi:UDP-N-acetylhexosamine pyrophosphorylase-like isoform X2 [Haliotis rufescens]|uniref:UDP-N-acetylhexosamine pyrophosphorylase-like isoform X2 n=1 Tax=Haliotis rufescens TaxID=6454 RepID=UPI001EB0727B|nr:UDP-N-acetylhexosamine pyrophosphorylase-like isoform X2 [Haliotis rufescens]